tara:strand:+ start:9343 stop:9828 length:486 start_codon:yes stop_codon:yes gene_type:complete
MTNSINTKKKVWEIVSGDRIMITFKGTQAQAEIFQELQYDETATTLREALILDLDEIKIEADEDSVQFFNGEEEIIALSVIDEEFLLYDIDCDCLMDEPAIDPEKLLRFPNFVPFAVCEICDGSGITTEMDCNMGSASNCCGGCERNVECQCDGVIYEFIN